METMEWNLAASTRSIKHQSDPFILLSSVANVTESPISLILFLPTQPNATHVS